MIAALTALALAQITTGAQPVPGDPNAVPTMPERPPRAERTIPGDPSDAGPPLSSRLERCLIAIRSNPQEALNASERWLAEVAGSDRAEAGHCRGLALARLERFGEAQDALVGARDMVEADDYDYRARLGGMAANAALAAGETRSALDLLGQARGDAIAAGSDDLAFGLQLDQAGGHVALGQYDEASALLADARATRPDSADAWLLSAALSRQMGQFAEAQQQIEGAASLAPRDPQIGLEAGIIAASSGREEAARQSWQSVVELAPGTPFAEIARNLLQQLDVP